MRIIHSVSQMRAASESIRTAGRRLALAPTMGYLHEGHLSLIRKARQDADDVVVSVFVNPSQFGPGEDLDRYPRDPERDIRMSRDAGATILFMPDTREIYHPGHETHVSLSRLPVHLCGFSRPGHFQGVATIVTKLFNIVRPHIAVFGEKDYQQLQVIRRMTGDLNFDIEIIGCPIVRETDGLAMSSRNRYLTPEQRREATVLFAAMEHVKDRVRKGERSVKVLLDAARNRILQAAGANIDYLVICDAGTLEELAVLDYPARMAMAVHFGATRLIDNCPLAPAASPV